MRSESTQPCCGWALTSICGVYGMNFDTKIGKRPERGWRHDYIAFWIVTLDVAHGEL